MNWKDHKRHSIFLWAVMGRIMLPAFVLEGWRRGITVGVAAMGRIGPRKNRREVAGLAAGPMGPMTDNHIEVPSRRLCNITLLEVYYKTEEGTYEIILGN